MSSTPRLRRKLLAVSSQRSAFQASARCWRLWLTIGALAMALFAADVPGTVNQVIVLVRAGIHSGQSDGSIAKSLHRIKLSEGLAARVIEELESEGAGART